MESFAACASEFSLRFVENVSSVICPNEINSDWIIRAITIRSAIAKRPDAANPLVWFNELIDAVGNYPK